MNLDYDPNRRLMTTMFVTLILPVIAIGVKRSRERAEELVAAVKVRSSIGSDRKKRKPNVRRNREGLIEELRALDEATFTRMFRMDQNTFFQLHERCASRIKVTTPKGDKMARLSCGGGPGVTSLILLAGKIAAHVHYISLFISLIYFALEQQQFAGWQAVLYGTLVSCSRCPTKLFMLTSTK